MNFVLANYELLNGLSQGLKTVCNDPSQEANSKK